MQLKRTNIETAQLLLLRYSNIATIKLELFDQFYSILFVKISVISQMTNELARFQLSHESSKDGIVISQTAMT